MSRRLRRKRLKDAARAMPSKYRCDGWWVTWVAFAQRRIVDARRVRQRRAVFRAFNTAYELAKG